MRRRFSSCLCAGFLCLFVAGATASAIGVGDTVRVAANLNVRNGPGTNYPEITDPDYRGTAPAGTIAKIIAGPQNANGYTWWRVDFGPGLYMGWAVQEGLQAAARSQPPVARVALTLYVYAGSVGGALIPAARVTGQDGGGKSFDQTTSTAGYVTIYGTPGTWRFTATKDAYQVNSWSQDISSTCTRYAFLQRLPTPPSCLNRRRPASQRLPLPSLS